MNSSKTRKSNFSESQKILNTINMVAYFYDLLFLQIKHYMPFHKFVFAVFNSVMFLYPKSTNPLIDYEKGRWSTMQQY